MNGKNNKNKASHRALSAAIAIMMVASAVLIINPASAHPINPGPTPCPNDAPADYCKHVWPISTHYRDYTIGVKQQSTVREVYLMNMWNDHVDYIEFEIPWIDDKGRKRIQFEHESYAFGAKVDVDNTHDPAQVKFDGKDDVSKSDYWWPAASPVPTPKLFHLSMSAIGNPSDRDNPIPLCYQPFYVNDGPGMRHCTRVGEEFPMNLYIDKRQPRPLPGGALTLDLEGNPDGTRDGRLDHILLTWDERIDRRTLDVGQFQVRGYEVLKAEWQDAFITSTEYIIETEDLYRSDIDLWQWYGKCPKEVPGSTRSNDVTGCSQVMLTIEQKMDYDTGARPEVRVASGPLADIAGNKVSRSSIETVDGASPMLMMATAVNIDDDFTDYEEIRFRFTEWVQRSDQTPSSGFTYPATDPAGRGKARPPDFDLQDNGANGAKTNQGANGQPDNARTFHPPQYMDNDDYDYVQLRFEDYYEEAGANPGPRDYDMHQADLFDANGPDRIRCSEASSDPLSRHLRGRGNGGPFYVVVDNTGSLVGGDTPPAVRDPNQPNPPAPYYQNTTDFPALDPHELRSKDMGHGLACESNWRDIQTTCPLVNVDTDIWRDWAMVYFDCPVAGFDPDDRTEMVPLPLGSLDVITTNGGGPRGIREIIHEPCTHFAKVIFETGQRVEPTDVDSTPSHIRVVPDRVRVCATGATPTNTLFDKPVFIEEMDVPFVDITTPKLHYARTIDRDSNGIVDGFFLKFTEPVSDDSFCSNAANGVCTNPAAIKLKDMGALPIYQADWNDYGPFTYDTDAIVDDDEAILKWDEGFVDGNGIFNARGPMHPLGMHTGIVPDLRIDANVIKDLVRPGGNLNEAMVNEGDIFEYDSAPPVVWLAETVDRENDPVFSDTPDCLYGGPLRCDPDPDGMLDGYRVTFSEKVNDIGTFDGDDWSVDGYQITGFSLENRVGDVLLDEVMLIDFNEDPSKEGDTGETPELTYNRTKDSQGGGFSDLVGNRMLNFGTTDVDETDDARPAIFRIEGFIGAENITIYFSEGVDDGAGEQVVRDDFTYRNIDGLPVDGFNQSTRFEPDKGFRDVNEVLHAPGEKKAVIPLKGKLSQSDLQNDKILARALSVREVAPTVEDKKFIVNKERPLNLAPDVSAPCAIRDLSADLVTADTIRLAWTAVADDCTPSGADLGGSVTGYVLKVNETAFDMFNSTSDMLPEGVELEFGALASPGTTQTVRIVGLNVSTLYHIAVRARDDAGNTGPAADFPVDTYTFEPLAVRTLEDVTPPTGRLTISSSTHASTKYSEVLRAQFSWTGLTDSESTINYHYRLNQLPVYQVVPGDDDVGDDTEITLDIPGDGEWYLHVRGFSAGGPAPETATFALKIGAVPLNDDDMVSCDEEVNKNLKVTRRKGLNRLNWTLPDCAEDLGELQAVWIWRLQPGGTFFEPIDTIDGTLATLREYNYTDPLPDQTDKTGYILQLEYSSGTNAQAQGQRAGDPTAETYSVVQPEVLDRGAIPAWIWILLGVALALLIAGLVIFLVLRGKDKTAAAATAAGYQWEEIGGGPSGVDSATGLPTHDIKCPSCATRFQAVGETPLEVTCPNCRVSGTLD